MSEQPNQRESESGPPRTILVVEDETMLRIVAAEVLSDAGFNVMEASHGGEALKILESGKRIDLVLSDVKMPIMNGYQLAEAGLTLQPELKFLLMTGYSQEPLPPLLSRAGIEVLRKPFEFGQLAKIVRQVLES